MISEKEIQKKKEVERKRKKERERRKKGRRGFLSSSFHTCFIVFQVFHKHQNSQVRV